MKVVFVVGFSPSVKELLNKTFESHCDQGSIVWVAQGLGLTSDIAKFKEVFFSRLDALKPAEVVVLFAVPPDNTWGRRAIEGIMGGARSRYSECGIGLDFFSDFGNFAGIKNRIEGLQIPGPEPISVELVRDRLQGKKVICVVAAGRPTILEALERAKFPVEAINEYFDQEVIQTGMNSTLMQHLEAHIKSYHHMLYAWANLRTSSKGLVQGFKRKGIFFEADSASKVVESLRRFISRN